MRAHPLSRLALCLAALAVAFLAKGAAILVCVAIVACAYAAVGEFQLMRRLAFATAPMAAGAALMWLFVDDRSATNGLRSALQALAAPGSGFLALATTITAAWILALSLAAMPDGEHYPTLRRMGLPSRAALMIAIGLGLVATIRESLESSVVALRVHGLLTTDLRSRIATIPKIVGLTWVACLGLVTLRAELKWHGNAFLRQCASSPVSLALSRRDTLVCAASAAFLVLACAMSHAAHLL